MKKKTIAALSALLLVSGAGVGTAAALLVQSANANGSGQADEAVVLNWGENQSVNWQDIDSLSPTSPVYAQVSVAAPLITGNANGSAVFTLSLTKGTETNDAYAGLKVEASTTAWTSSESGMTNEGEVFDITIPDDPETDPEKTSIDFTVTEATTYYVRISLSEEAYNTLYVTNAKSEDIDSEASGTYNLSATLTASYHFVETDEQA